MKALTAHDRERISDTLRAAADAIQLPRPGWWTTGDSGWTHAAAAFGVNAEALIVTKRVVADVLGSSVARLDDGTDRKTIEQTFLAALEAAQRIEEGSAP